MPSTKDLTTKDFKGRVLVVGPVGSGKSQFAASAPGPGFLIDCGGEALSYRDTDPPFDYEFLPYDWRSGAKFIRIINDLKAGIVPFSKTPENKEGIKKAYKTVVLDNLTALTDISMAKAMIDDQRRDPGNQPIWNVHFKISAGYVGDWVRLFLEVPGSRIVICHLANDKKDEPTGKIIFEPQLGGQLRAKIPTLFDEVLYAVTRGSDKGVEYMLQTVNKGYFKARSRLSGKEHLLPDFIPNEWDYLVGTKKYEPKVEVKK